MGIYSYGLGMLRRVSYYSDILYQFVRPSKCVSNNIIILDLTNQSASRITIRKQRTDPVHTKFGEV